VSELNPGEVAEVFLRDRLIARLPTGRESATKASVLADELGISTREVGALVADLVENDQWLIGSTCGGDHGAGYFIIRDLADLEAGTAHIVARAKRSFVRVAALRRAARERFSEQEVLHLFSLEDVS
jgi:hypothetical protein